MKTENITLVLDDGREMKFELYPEIAPLTVENFLSLIDGKFFDGLCFHRIIANFMIQGGGFVHGKTLAHKEAPRTVKGEFKSNGVNNPLKHTLGVISMARTPNPNSASSQFFICVTDTPFLDGEYAAFGKTRDEQSAALAVELSKVATGSFCGYDDVPFKPVVIKTIKRG